MTTPAHHCRTIRLPGYNYAQPGAYFVTIVIQNRMNRFGEIRNEIMIINDAGNLIESCWLNLPQLFPGIELDEYIIMPNHFHGIIFIKDETVGAALVAAWPTVGRVGGRDEPYPYQTSDPGGCCRGIQIPHNASIHGWDE